MTQTYEEFVEFLKRPGAKATIMRYSWLKRGCPYCGGKKWDVTCDGWAYCHGCNAGLPTYDIWVSQSQVVDTVDFSESEE